MTTLRPRLHALKAGARARLLRVLTDREAAA
jgi:hypothetical protein